MGWVIILITWITETVAIGEYLDVTSENLEREKITWVINLRGIAGMVESAKEWKRIQDVVGTGYSYIPIKTDPDEDLITFQRQCLRAVRELLRVVVAGNRVLIHCTAGMDRAPFVVALLLAMTRNLIIRRINVMGAYLIIKKLRPQIIEHLEWLKGW